MAANLQVRGVASFGKRLVGQIRSRDSLPIIPPLSLTLRCVGVHSSAYDKNQEDHVQANMVPDHVMPPQPEVYWAPHPKTGVFGPTTGSSDEHEASASEDSVLEQKTFFRPLEDLDKPPVQP
ncbi:hypothetical protein ACP275_06G011200 [Erythranthe tilingii]